MGSGAWGCDGTDAASPCHMTAWSKEVLGWVDVTTLPRGADLGLLVLDPVETSGEGAVSEWTSRSGTSSR